MIVDVGLENAEARASGPAGSKTHHRNSRDRYAIASHRPGDGSGRRRSAGKRIAAAMTRPAIAIAGNVTHGATPERYRTAVPAARRPKPSGGASAQQTGPTAEAGRTEDQWRRTSARRAQPPGYRACCLAPPRCL